MGWRMMAVVNYCQDMDDSPFGTFTDEPHPDNVNNSLWRPAKAYLHWRWFRLDYSRAARIFDFGRMGYSKQVSAELAAEHIAEELKQAQYGATQAVTLVIYLGDMEITQVHSAATYDPVNLTEELQDLVDAGMVAADQYVQGMWSMYCSEVLSRLPLPYVAGVNKV